MAALAHGSATNLLAILNDILDFSKIEAGALNLSVEPVDLRLLMQEITEPHALVSKRRAVALTSSVAPELPTMIRADRLRLGQIVNNLVSNAVKFTKTGTITVQASLVRSDDGDKLRVQVDDTGCGMDQTTLARLFQPFTQADGSSSRQAEGTGLGLCISRRLAELFDGTLNVASTPGQGSSFALEMPCISEHKPVEAVGRAEETETLANCLKSLRILVVDDNPTNQWLTQRQLTTMGAEVETASTGQSALDILASAEFDVMITDCHMPGMDGAALTVAVRQADAPWSNIPIFGLTADVTAEQAQLCKSVGMAEVLYKPVQRRRLAEAFGNHRPKPPAPPPDALIFDLSLFRDLFDDADPEGHSWLAAYLRSAETLLPSLLTMCKAADPDKAAIASLAHQLVGASLSVGANRLASSLRHLEHAAKDRKDLTIIATIAETAGRDGVEAIAAISAFSTRAILAAA